MARETKIAVALGGGAALAFAHVGVLRTFEEEGIGVHLLTGASMGSLVGAMYAVEPNARAVESRLVKYFTGPEFRKITFDVLRGRKREESKAGALANFTASLRKNLFYGISLTRQSFLSEERYELNIHQLVPDTDLAHTRIPLGVVAGDLVTGRRRFFTHGPLRKLIAGSCSIPGIFPPVPYNDMLLIDGSWVSSVPTEDARHLGADFVVAVDIEPVVHEQRRYQSALDILIRSGEMSRRYLSRNQQPDVLVPIEIEGVFWGEWNRVEEMIQRGAEVARRYVDVIHRELRRRRPWRIFT